MWIKLVDEIIMDLEEAIKYLESVPIIWRDKPEEEPPVPIKIYIKELIESVKTLRTTNISPREKYDILNKNLVLKIIFWKDILLKMDFEKYQSIKDKAFEELVRAETQLIHLREITKEEMSR